MTWLLILIFGLPMVFVFLGIHTGAANMKYKSAEYIADKYGIDAGNKYLDEIETY